MIIKTYRDDGSPNMARWLVTCDIPGCRTSTLLLGSASWLIPEHPDMPTYCPACLQALADFAIGTALHCPYCGSVYLAFGLHNITCEDCGHLIASYNINDLGDTP